MLVIYIILHFCLFIKIFNFLPNKMYFIVWLDILLIIFTVWKFNPQRKLNHVLYRVGGPPIVMCVGGWDVGHEKHGLGRVGGPLRVMCVGGC